jgi:hypothetical protein
MAKNTLKKRNAGPVSTPRSDAAPAKHFEWESVELEFFAREADLYRANPVENFEDLDGD